MNMKGFWRWGLGHCKYAYQFVHPSWDVISFYLEPPKISMVLRQARLKDDVFYQEMDWVASSMYFLEINASSLFFFFLKKLLMP